MFAKMFKSNFYRNWTPFLNGNSVIFNYRAAIVERDKVLNLRFENFENDDNLECLFFPFTDANIPKT
jgi:hypothetical protein